MRGRRYDQTGACGGEGAAGAYVTESCAAVDRRAWGGEIPRREQRTCTSRVVLQLISVSSTAVHSAEGLSRSASCMCTVLVLIHQHGSQNPQTTRIRNQSPGS